MFKNIWPLLLILIFWQISASLGIINTTFISSPFNIVLSFSNIVFLQLLSLDLIYSLSRIILGLVFAYLSSLFLVYIGFWVPAFHQFLSSVNSLWKYLPAPVLIPLAILAFGLTDFTKIAVISFTSLVLYLGYCLSILDKDYSQYTTLAGSWKFSPNQRFFSFFLPQNNFLNYRIIPNLVLWAFATTILSELILGGQYGLGIRLLQFQQLYNTSFLYAYLAVILTLAFGLETLLISSFSKFKWDIWKMVSNLSLIVVVIVSLGFQFPVAVKNISQSDKMKIVTYKGVLNLPLYVYIEKFNSLKLDLELVGTGLQSTDTLLAGKAAVAGYSDIPNALQALQSNSNLKLLGQVVETPKRPALFLVSNESLSENDFSKLNNSNIGYFPNNPIIQQGLDFVLFTKKVRTSSVTYTSSNDPNSLVQALTAGKIKGLVAFEPYIQDVEEALSTKRVNPDQTLISTLKFTNLPLAGLMLNESKLSLDEQKQLSDGITKSINFINQNTDSNNQSTGELKDIMTKYEINPRSKLPVWQNSTQLKVEDLNQIIGLLKNYQVTGFDNLNEDSISKFYWK